MTDYDYTFKLMMLGDASVGKTSLTYRYISGFFTPDLRLTIGVDFYSKTTEFNSKKVKLQIWDFGGEERFRFLLSQYCKGANGAFFLYDITNVQSIGHLPDWTQIVRENAGDIPIMLIGSKSDLDEYRTVPREDGILAAKKYNLSSFIELSSKTGQNVEKAFNVMTETLFEVFHS
ncbi:MAG: Rab family GTPase [Promethearchaeota archaeon]|jgi:Ras-related protein Rab-43